MWVHCRAVRGILTDHHYLGPINRGVAWRDEFGCIIIGAPTARLIPTTWVELIRWCLVRNRKNDGSKQWAVFVKALKQHRPELTTIVSYSDPVYGHNGALYRACNWWWAPTWHRIEPCPSGNGSWSNGTVLSPKDRWIYALRRDKTRAELINAKSRKSGVLRRNPWAEYKEPGGTPYRVLAARPSDETTPVVASTVQPCGAAPLFANVV